MIEKFVIGNKSLNDELELELKKPNLSGIYVREVTGLGYPSSSIPITEIALSDINYYNHSLFETRNIVFTLSFVTGVNVELIRQILYKFFPSKVEIKITIHTTDQTPVYITGYVETFEPSIFSKDETIQISILCINPYFITEEKISQSFTGSSLTFFSNQFVNNGLLYYLSPMSGGLDCFKISYSNGYITFGNQERFYYPYDQKTIDDSLPDYEEIMNVVEENVIKPNQKILFDTSIDNFGIYILDNDNNIITDITSKCYVYGEYPSVSYGNNDYHILAYSVKESDNNLEYQDLQTIYINTASWDTDPITESDAHPLYYDPGTIYYERPLELITANSGSLVETDTTYWKWPRLLVLSFYDCQVKQDENPPIERLIGNIIVNGLHFASLEENTSYYSRYYLVCKQDLDSTIKIGQSISVGSFKHLPADITKSSRFLVNPFYDGKNFIINDEKDFKEFLYKFVRYGTTEKVDNKPVGYVQRYYLAVKDGVIKNIFNYESCASLIQSKLYWDDYKAGL